MQLHLDKFFSFNHLVTAWHQIQTGQNKSYKFYFSHIYNGYEIALEENLKSLSANLTSGGFKNNQVLRIFSPKSPNSQRPYTLLTVEDQIAYQAFAGYVAKKIAKQRQKFEQKSVFSNIISQHPHQLFDTWIHNYIGFQNATENKVQSGLYWVVTCDLASFYDTVSHDILFNQIPLLKKPGLIRKHFSDILSGWTFEKPVESRSHGLPQGPIASDLLAEAFLLVLDERLTEAGINYIRYVDDIRLFAKSKHEAQQKALKLEKLLRNLGLVPQPEKFSILELVTGKELNKIEYGPSYNSEYVDDPDDYSTSINAEKTKLILDQALKDKKKPNSTKIKYAFFRGEVNARTRQVAIKLAKDFPQFVEAAIVFLRKGKKKGDLLELIKTLMKESSFDYVLYKCWAFYSHFYNDLNSSDKSRLSKLAIDILKDQKKYEHPVILGAGLFLLKHSEINQNKQNKFVFNIQNRFLLSLLLKYMSSKPYGFSSQMCLRIHSQKMPDIGLAILHQFDNLRSVLAKNISQVKSKKSPYLKSFNKLIGKKLKGSVDPLNHGIQDHFNIQIDVDLKKITGRKWQSCLRYLVHTNLNSHPSIWLKYVNSLGEILIHSLISVHNKSNPKNKIKIYNKKGELLSYGSILNKNDKLDKAYPGLCDGFRNINTRRNNETASHPYDKKTGKKTKTFMKSEQETFKKHFAASMSIFCNASIFSQFKI